MDTGVNWSRQEQHSASSAQGARSPRQRPKAVRRPPAFQRMETDENQIRRMDQKNAQTRSSEKSYVSEIQALAFTDEIPIGVSRTKKNVRPKPPQKKPAVSGTPKKPRPRVKTSEKPLRAGAGAKTHVAPAEAEKHRKKVIVPRRMSLLKRILFAGALLLVLLMAVTAGIYGLFFQITEIEVSGLTRYAEEDILAVSGVEMGDLLFSFSSKTVKETIISRYPFIRSIEVTRILPNRIELNVTEDRPIFYANVFGEYYLLASDLRVLGKSVEAPLELVRLRLPLVHKAVAGAPLEFMTEKNERYVQQTTSDMLASPMAGRIDSIDLRDKYNLTMIADSRYKLIMGTVSEVQLRLKLAGKVLEDTMFQTGNKAIVDLTRLNETSVIIDNQLVLD